jgi:hypothetical protein
LRDSALDQLDRGARDVASLCGVSMLVSDIRDIRRFFPPLLS